MKEKKDEKVKSYVIVKGNLFSTTILFVLHLLPPLCDNLNFLNGLIVKEGFSSLFFYTPRYIFYFIFCLVEEELIELILYGIPLLMEFIILQMNFK